MAKVRVGKLGSTEMLCAFVTEDRRSGPEIAGLDPVTARSVKQSAADMGGKLGATAVVPAGRRVRRILLAGLGPAGGVTGDTVRHVAGTMAKEAARLGLGGFSVMLPPGPAAGRPAAAARIVEGATMALYKFEKFKSEKGRAPPGISIVGEPAEVAAAVRAAESIAGGAVFAKDVANLPPNECSPATLASIARSVARKGGMKCTVVSGAALGRGGFGGISAVGQGSRNGPRLIILEHSGGPRGSRPVLLVGKAVTFDTGGISLKPGEKMDEMKFDKCGGCTVLGIMRAASEMRLPVNVVGIIPSVENMPGGGSYRPGDIITLYSGKTAEIINTDAEGRLILADALAYGEKRYSPRAVIDFATLTGACIVALGTNVAGMVSNDPGLAGSIRESSARTAEAVWELPLNDDYMGMIKSDVADMRNMGIGRAAGTIAAAAFLRNAIGDTPWVHLDIAGVAWTQPATKARSYNPKGATGFGVRLAMDYLQNLS